jgi:hypothetical protein
MAVKQSAARQRFQLLAENDGNFFWETKLRTSTERLFMQSSFLSHRRSRNVHAKVNTLNKIVI